jgi:DNA-binding HxlR family transcriptional regulator
MKWCGIFSVFWPVDKPRLVVAALLSLSVFFTVVAGAYIAGSVFAPPVMSAASNTSYTSLGVASTTEASTIEGSGTAASSVSTSQATSQFSTVTGSVSSSPATSTVTSTVTSPSSGEGTTVTTTVSSTSSTTTSGTVAETTTTATSATGVTTATVSTTTATQTLTSTVSGAVSVVTSTVGGSGVHGPLGGGGQASTSTVTSTSVVSTAVGSFSQAGVPASAPGVSLERDIQSSALILAPICWVLLGGALVWRGRVRSAYSEMGFGSDVFELFMKMKGGATRIKVLNTLTTPKDRLQLAEELGVDWKTIDRHVQILNKYGFVREQAAYGTVRMYEVTPLGKMLLNVFDEIGDGQVPAGQEARATGSAE